MAVEIGRRPVLSGALFAGAGALVKTAPVRAATPGAATLDLTSQQDQSLIFRKLAYSADGRLGFWHLSAIRYGLVGAKLIPFWEMHIGRFFTTQDLADGSYAVTQAGLTYYTDLETGAYLRQFQNPLTGKRVEIQYETTPKARRYAAPAPIRTHYEGHYEAIDVRGAEPAGGRKPGLATVGALGPAWTQGDHIWIEQDHMLEYPSPRDTKVLARVNDLTSYFGLIAEVADPNVKMPRAGHTFTDINDWPPWLEMGDQPGAYYSRGMGFKAASFEEMPAAWKALALQEHPVIARDPLKLLQAV